MSRKDNEITIHNTDGQQVSKILTACYVFASSVTKFFRYLGYHVTWRISWFYVRVEPRHETYILGGNVDGRRILDVVDTRSKN